MNRIAYGEQDSAPILLASAILYILLLAKKNKEAGMNRIAYGEQDSAPILLASAILYILLLA